MYNFSAKAKECVSGCPLMVNRTKMTTEEISNKYADGVTLVDFDIIVINGERVPVFVTAEEPNAYFYGGTALLNIVNEWLSDYDGDLTKCAEDFRNSDGLRVQLEYKKTRTGKNFVNVIVF